MKRAEAALSYSIFPAHALTYNPDYVLLKPLIHSHDPRSVLHADH